LSKGSRRGRDLLLLLPSFRITRRDRLPRAHLLRTTHVNRIFFHERLPLQLQSLVFAALGLRVQRRPRRLRSPHRPSRSCSSSSRSPAASTPPTTASERLWITASDGTLVPISIVYRRDRFRRIAINPLYVYGYGSYGYPLPVGFSPRPLAARPRRRHGLRHIRGGGELATPWHDAGKMSLKSNTFTDFIAAAEQLVMRGYGNANKVAIEGGSAGGLLMGAVVNLAAASASPTSSASCCRMSPSSM